MQFYLAVELHDVSQFHYLKRTLNSTIPTFSVPAPPLQHRGWSRLSIVYQLPMRPSPPASWAYHHIATGVLLRRRLHVCASRWPLPPVAAKRQFHRQCAEAHNTKCPERLHVSHLCSHM